MPRSVSRPALTAQPAPTSIGRQDAVKCSGVLCPARTDTPGDQQSHWVPAVSTSQLGRHIKADFFRTIVSFKLKWNHSIQPTWCLFKTASMDVRHSTIVHILCMRPPPQLSWRYATSLDGQRGKVK